MSSIGAVILAAGASTRLGRPKQLQHFGGVTLIRRAAQAALNCGMRVVVVTGASADSVGSELETLPVLVVHNADWQSGMGGSIKTGVTVLASSCEAIVLMTCDQPLVTPESIAKLIAARNQNPIVAASYEGVVGVPALFDRSYFPRLLALQGDQGARLMIRENMDQVASIAMPEAALDIDTANDLARIGCSGGLRPSP